MTRQGPKRATAAELAYIRDLERASAFTLLDQGRAEIVTPANYPEPLKRFLKRERDMVHVKLPRVVKRKLIARSHETGVSVEELIRRWIEAGIKRDAG